MPAKCRAMFSISFLKYFYFTTYDIKSLWNDGIEFKPITELYTKLCSGSV